MYLTKKITANVGAFYSIEEQLSDVHRKMKTYMENHGWEAHLGSYEGKYDGFRYSGHMRFQKEFEDISTMESEIKEIELLFHAADTPVTRYSRSKER